MPSRNPALNVKDFLTRKPRLQRLSRLFTIEVHFPKLDVIRGEQGKRRLTGGQPVEHAKVAELPQANRLLDPHGAEIFQEGTRPDEPVAIPFLHTDEGTGPLPRS